MKRPLDPELSERATEAMERLDVAQQELASAMAELIVPDHADTTFVT
jgi:hypothetical protein